MNPKDLYQAVFTPDTSIPDEQLVSEYKWIHVALTTLVADTGYM